MKARRTPCLLGARTRYRRHFAGGGVLQAAALTVVFAIALGACSGGDPDDDADPGSSTSSPAADPTASEPETDARLTGAPVAGTCWRMPPATAEDEKHWFDDSPQVPCTQRHTLQTVAVYPVDKATPKAALEQDAVCDQDARLYIGTSSKNWVPWHYYLYLPSRDQVADGASWVRCDVAWAALSSGFRPTLATGSAEEMALRHPEEVWGCLDVFPQPTQPRPYAPCDKPHAYEATGHLLFLEDLDGYPTPRELRSAAADCRVALRNPDYEGLALRALWRPPDEMWGPDRLTGTCWVRRPDGQDLPPLK